MKGHIEFVIRGDGRDKRASERRIIAALHFTDMIATEYMEGRVLREDADLDVASVATLVEQEAS